MNGSVTIWVNLAALGIAPAFGASTCERLTALKLENTSVTLAETVAPGAFMPPGPARGKGKQGAAFRNLPAFYRVAAALTPATDSEIKIDKTAGR
jgi:hypothetical protein